MTACWLNGKLVDPAEARVSLFDHGLLYGDGVFEGIRFYQGRAFRLAAHLRRLRDSARAIHLSLPYAEPALSRAVADVVAAYPQPEGYLRLGVTRGIGPLGLDTVGCVQPTTFILAGELRRLAAPSSTDAAGESAATGLRVILAAIRRIPADCLDPRVKSLNYLNNILAREEARRAGADEAIMLNREGRVAEGASDNLFIVRDGCLLTPPVSDGGLKGITRGVVFELAAALGIACTEASLTAADLYSADECFLTGTAIEMAAVSDIDGRCFAAPGKVFTRLQAAFVRLIDEECTAMSDEVQGP